MAKAFVSKLNGFSILRASVNWIHLACRFYYLMKMSGSGSFVTQNNIAFKEGNVSSTESTYSLQSEQYNPKRDNKAVFNRKRLSKRKDKLKRMRQNGNFNNVPKYIPKPRQGTDFISNDSSDYIHQSLVDRVYPSSVLDQATATFSALDPDASVSSVLEILEVLGALAISLPLCNTPSQVASQILLSVRAMTKGSVIEAVLRKCETVKWCQELFGFNLFEQQAGAPQNASWLNSLPSLRENWDAVQNAPLFTKISSVITVAASIGLCSVTNLNWSIKGVDLFRIGTLKKHSTAIDLVGAVLDTVVCFIEGGYECFKSGSFEPLLFTSDDSKELDSLYFPLLELHEHAMIFNLHAKPVKIRGVTRTINDIEYSQLLDEAHELAERAYLSAKGTWQQGYLEKRREVLHKNRAAYQAKRIDGSMRFAPFTIFIWGESGVGKSTVAQVLMADCLAAAGVNPDPKGVAVIKESDKFDSTLKGDTVGIFFDDMGNTKSEFLDKAPTERVIDINNNMITYANKADLHEKGKVEIRPRVFVITSNAPLCNHANVGSIKPFSIVRRADVHIYVNVKPEYVMTDLRLDSNKVFKTFPGDSLVNDIWDLDLYIPRERKHGGDGHHLISINGTTEKTVCGINDAIMRITEMCETHFRNQTNLIMKGEGLVKSRCYCPTCNRAHDLCLCPDPIHYLDADEEETLAYMSWPSRSEWGSSSGSESEVTMPSLEERDGTSEDGKDEEQAEQLETFAFIEEQFAAMGEYTDHFLSMLPTWFFMNPVVSWVFLCCNIREFWRYEKICRYGTMFSLVIFLFLTIFSAQCQWDVIPVMELIIHIGFYYAMLARWRDKKLLELTRRRDLTDDFFLSIRQHKLTKFLSICIVAKLVHSFIIMFKGASAIQQSALSPETVEEITHRDSEANPWARPIVEELHVSDKAATMTHQQVVDKVRRNLVHGTFVENNFQTSCDMLALGGTIFLAPMHLFKNRKDMRARVTRKDPTLLNSTFRAMVSVNYIIPIPGKDLCVVNITSGGVFEDILHLFPTSITASGTATFIHKSMSGEVSEDTIRLQYTQDSDSGGPGFEYKLPYDTYTGLCMSTAVAKYARNCIACVHLRGIPNTPQGKGLTVHRDELTEAIAKAHTIWRGAFPVVSNGTFPTERYERQVLESRDIHPKSPINYMPLGSGVEFLGQAGTRISHTNSKVRVTPISETVTEETGVPNTFGPPKFHRTLMWQASLAHSANPSPGIEGSLLEAAYADYVDHLVERFSEPALKDWVHAELKPLSQMETLCGIDGKRFIDAMPKGTSKGFPLTGPKREMIELLSSDDYPDFQCPAFADPVIIEQMEKMEATLLSGERCYSIFKACVKDEPTKLGKDKVRVFQAADWATQMMVRKYFLPIARMLSLFPIDSECAVGVNAQGPEWDQLAGHMKKFGDNRILAGDYSKYDLRMPAQLINASFAVLIEIAEKCGQYSEDDIKIMKGIATEIAYCCVAYNGDMIILLGSHPSGHNLTVYINCIGNSLLVRGSYFHNWPHPTKPEPFRKNVAAMTYGDDLKGSVRPGYDWFNHISFAKFLAEREMVFTMPDKTSIPTKYMLDSDADFLKRKNVFNDDTGLIHGALDEESIFKSLHTVLESKVVSLEDQSISNIDGALREWWQHGRTVYETRRSQMKRVASTHQISDACKMLDVSYEDRLAEFRERYADNAKVKALIPIVVTDEEEVWSIKA